MNKILKMIFHIVLMAIVVFAVGYLLGIPMQNGEDISLATPTLSPANTSFPQLTLALDAYQYKLHENIRMMFRPEWVWNEDKQDYDNVEEGLKRDPNTGMFYDPTPDTKPDDATWDGRLGLYISNDLAINHATGEIKDVTQYNTDTGIERPQYQCNEKTLLDIRFEEYCKVHGTVVPAHVSVYYHPWYFVKKKYIKKEHFIYEIGDLLMLKEKLMDGFGEDYTMTAIEISTNVKMDNIAYGGSSKSLRKWLNEFNGLLKMSREGFTPNEASRLGYLALPYIEDKIYAGDKQYLVCLNDIAKVMEWDEEIDSQEKAVSFYKKNNDNMNVIIQFIREDIKLPWLDSK